MDLEWKRFIIRVSVLERGINVELMNCANCKRIFNYISGDKFCPNCRKVLEEKFSMVKEYIRENPNKSVNEVSEAMEVSVRQLKKWVREERLSFSEDSLVGLDCERCGKLVHSGKFCPECAKSLANAMQEAVKVQRTMNVKGNSKGRMRFLD